VTERVLFAEPAHVAVLRRMHLIRQWDRSPLNRRIVIAIVVAWAPLVAVNLVRVVVYHDDAGLTFFQDIGVNARLLLAVPLLIAGEYIILPQLETLIGYFRASVVMHEDAAKFDAILDRARRRNAAIWPSAIMFLGAYTIVLTQLLFASHVHLPAWRLSSTTHFSPAGWWHALVGLPLLLGLIFAWLWRIAIWALFLRAVARLRLRLVSAHPDGAAGLQFLAYSPRPFVPIALAIGIVVAGGMANNVLYFGVSPLEHGLVPAVTAALVTLIIICPPLVFTRVLMDEWRAGILKYDELSRNVGRTFEHKWFNAPVRGDEAPLGEPDFSATTDLYSIVADVHAMRVFVFDYKSVVVIAGATLLPFAPIWLSAVPLDKMLHTISSLLL